MPDDSSPDDSEIMRAAQVLRAGGLVAFPTETVYGLGADATDEAAVRALFEVKGRPADHPVIVHVADAGDIARWAVPDRDGVAERLTAAYWPGPLTVIVERRVDAGGAERGGIVDAVTGGRPTVGLRAPDHPVALALLRAADRPIAAPSANRFGRVSPTTATDVRHDLAGDVDGAGASVTVLDGGPCEVGVESTIVDVTTHPPVIRRVGGLTRAAIEEVLGFPVEVDAVEGSASGTLASHYAPRARVELCSADLVATRVRALDAMGVRAGVLARRADLMDADEGDLDLGATTVDLTVDGDTAEFAHDLYRRLRRGDELGLDVVVAVVPTDGQGLGEAVADRLRRAAGGS